MSLTVDKLEKNMAKLTIEVSADKLEDAIKGAYNKQKSKLSVPGFRKGKVPQAYLEKMYGVEMFYEDAANSIIPEAYAQELDNCDLDVVSQPKIDVTQIERGKPFIFTAEVALMPEITLGDYKGIEVEKADVAVSDEEVEKEIQTNLEKNARNVEVTDRAVAEGDEVTIDFDGYMDGEQFQGGKGDNYPLVIGSHSFIEGFEDQLVDKNIGDDVEVNVTFPEDYQAEDLAGKPALFKVKIHAIKVKELPTLDDEFVQETSEFDTVADYKDDVKKTLEAKKTTEAKKEKENKVIDKIIENATMELPDPMVESQQKQMVEEFAQNMSYQGLNMEQYYQFTGTNYETLIEQVRPQAINRIKSRLVLDAIVKAEDIQVSEDELEEELKNMAATYQMELDKIKEVMGEKETESIKADIAVQKAAQLVVEQAKEI